MAVVARRRAEGNKRVLKKREQMRRDDLMMEREWVFSCRSCWLGAEEECRRCELSGTATVTMCGDLLV